jgi:hypothetical protein
MMKHDPLGHPEAARAPRARQREVNLGRHRVGEAVQGQGGLVREDTLLLGPQPHGDEVLVLTEVSLPWCATWSNVTRPCGSIWASSSCSASPVKRTDEEQKSMRRTIEQSFALCAHEGDQAPGRMGATFMAVDPAIGASG